MKLPVAFHRCRSLVVPHADGGSCRVAVEAERVRVHAGDDTLAFGGSARGCQDLVAAAARDEFLGQQVLPAVADGQRVTQPLRDPLLVRSQHVAHLLGVGA